MIDLGVTSTTSMTSKNHILNSLFKAQCMSGLVKRTLGFNAPVAIKLQLYLSHGRSILEYCTSLWSPYQVKEITHRERVHRQVTKCILNEYSSDVSYRDRCLTLGILPLCYRSEILDLCFPFQCLPGEIDININTHLQFVKSDTSRRSANKGTLFYMTKTVQAQYTYEL